MYTFYVDKRITVKVTFDQNGYLYNALNDMRIQQWRESFQGVNPLIRKRFPFSFYDPSREIRLVAANVKFLSLEGRGAKKDVTDNEIVFELPSGMDGLILEGTFMNMAGPLAP